MNKNIKKYLIVCFSLILCLSLFTACGKNSKVDKPLVTNQNNKESTPPESTTIPEDEENETISPDASPSIEEVSTTPSENTKELPIYTINEESLENEAAVALIPENSEINAELVVNAVVENLAEHSLIVGIDRVTVDKERVIVSFTRDTAPLDTVGAGVEATILDCISMSLLDNLESCNAVIFRAAGESYESGHIALGFDEAYKWN